MYQPFIPMWKWCEDVAVVEPAARVVLDEFEPERVGRAEGFGVDDRPVRVGPAVAVQVEGVEEVVEAVDVEADPLADLRVQVRRVAGVGAAVDAGEVFLQAGDRRFPGVEAEEELRLPGACSPGARTTSGPNSPLKTGSGSIGPWSW